MKIRKDTETVTKQDGSLSAVEALPVNRELSPLYCFLIKEKGINSSARIVYGKTSNNVVEWFSKHD